MDWAINQISTQWTVVMGAPAILFPVLLLGFFLGWGWSWQLLRQRLELHKDRAEFYKERADKIALQDPPPASAKPPVQHSVIAKKLEGFWHAGTDLINQSLQTEKDRAKWLKRSAKWQSDVENYLYLAGLGEEAAMFRTIPINDTKKQFRNSLDAAHNAGLNILEQKLAKLRRILGRAADRASQ
jgi:hypothetical protein